VKLKAIARISAHQQQKRESKRQFILPMATLDDDEVMLNDLRC